MARSVVLSCFRGNLVDRLTVRSNASRSVGYGLWIWKGSATSSWVSRGVSSLVMSRMFGHGCIIPKFNSKLEVPIARRCIETSALVLTSASHFIRLSPATNFKSSNRRSSTTHP